jgi:hypothetical protein
MESKKVCSACSSFVPHSRYTQDRFGFLGFCALTGKGVVITSSGAEPVKPKDCRSFSPKVKP